GRLGSAGEGRGDVLVAEPSRHAAVGVELERAGDRVPAADGHRGDPLLLRERDRAAHLHAPYQRRHVVPELLDPGVVKRPRRRCARPAGERDQHGETRRMSSPPLDVDVDRAGNHPVAIDGDRQRGAVEGSVAGLGAGREVEGARRGGEDAEEVERGGAAPGHCWHAENQWLSCSRGDACRSQGLIAAWGTAPPSRLLLEVRERGTRIAHSTFFRRVPSRSTTVVSSCAKTFPVSLSATARRASSLSFIRSATLPFPSTRFLERFEYGCPGCSPVSSTLTILARRMRLPVGTSTTRRTHPVRDTGISCLVQRAMQPVGGGAAKRGSTIGARRLVKSRASAKFLA